MLRYRHRFSRDIDLFVPDPQYEGFVTPRLSEAAENITSDYVEQGNFVKLVLDAGEVDVVALPNLTDEPFEIWEIMGQPVKVETAAEIVAKKLYHRGNRATARDLFDLAVVVEQEPTALVHAAPFLFRHAAVLPGLGPGRPADHARAVQQDPADKFQQKLRRVCRTGGRFSPFAAGNRRRYADGAGQAASLGFNAGPIHMSSLLRFALQLLVATAFIVMVAIVSRHIYLRLEGADSNPVGSPRGAVVPVNFDTGSECEQLLNRLDRQASASESAPLETARRGGCLHS